MDLNLRILNSNSSCKKSPCPSKSELKSINSDINAVQTKINTTIKRFSGLLHKIDAVSRLKSPYFTKSEKYLTGKHNLYMKKYELSDLQKLQREKNIMTLLEDADPDKKRYMYSSMLYDTDIRKALKKNKREFGFKPEVGSTYSSNYFQTFQVGCEQRQDLSKKDIKEFVSRNLNKILYNNTYYNSPKQQKKNDFKKIEEGLFTPTPNPKDGLLSPSPKHKDGVGSPLPKLVNEIPILKNSNSPHHKKSSTVLSSPFQEKKRFHRRTSTRLLTLSIRDEVRKNNYELLELKKSYSKLLKMKPTIRN